MRATGKTFRALLESLKMASEGRDVIFECTNMDMAKWTFTKAIEMSKGFIDDHEYKNMIIRIGDGSVKFSPRLGMSDHRRTNGSRDRVVSDIIY